MKSTEVQDMAAAKVVEAARLLQHSIRQAQKNGLKVSCHVHTYSDNPAEVDARVYLEEELTVASTDEKRKKQ